MQAVILDCSFTRNGKSTCCIRTRSIRFLRHQKDYPLFQVLSSSSFLLLYIVVVTFSIQPSSSFPAVLSPRQSIYFSRDSNKNSRLTFLQQRSAILTKSCHRCCVPFVNTNRLDSMQGESKVKALMSMNANNDDRNSKMSNDFVESDPLLVIKDNNSNNTTNGNNNKTNEYGTVLIQSDDNNPSNDNDTTIASTITTSTTTSIGDQILSLAIPAGAALLIDPLMTLIDTAFVGRYYLQGISSDPLAGMGSAASLLTFSFYLCNFLCTASTPLIAQQRASGNQPMAQQIGGQVLSLALVLGFGLILVLTLFGQTILYNVMGTSYTGMDADRYANQFLSIRAWAAPAVLCIEASTGILRGYLDTRTPIMVLIIANVINLILDVILIIGFQMGPQGAAIATTTAEWISALLFLGILAGIFPSASIEPEIGSNQKSKIMAMSNNNSIYQNQLAIQAKNSKNDGTTTGTSTAATATTFVSIVPIASVPSWDDVKPLIVASSSVFFRSLILQLSLSGAAAMAARSSGDAASSEAMAAHQIGIQLWLICSFFCDSLAAASQGLIADALGRDDPRSVRDISKTVFLYSTYLGLFLACLIQIGLSSGWLLDFFTRDPSVVRTLKDIIPLIILAQPLNALVFAADGVLQGGSQFPFQARAMVLSGVTAVASFAVLETTTTTMSGGDSLNATLVHVWVALLVLQLMRGLTSLWKIIDVEGPINLLDRKR